MSAPVNHTVSPAERRKLRVRAAILEAAEKVFAEEGEAGLSIRRLAEEIDYSPAAIYKYFDSKDALVEVLKEAFFEKILVLIDQSLASDAPFPERARNCMTGYIKTALEKPNHYAAAFSGISQEGAPVSMGTADLAGPPSAMDAKTPKRRAFNFLVDMIQTGQAGGYMRADIDPDHAAFCVWSACHGMAMILIHTQPIPGRDANASPAALDAMIWHHANIFVTGLEAGAPNAPLTGSDHSRSPSTTPTAYGE